MAITRRDLCSVSRLWSHSPLPFRLQAGQERSLASVSSELGKPPAENRDHAQIRRVMKGKLAASAFCDKSHQR
jgi:hypothetical protein